VPSLDLRFADNKSLTDAVTGALLVTFTRASSGTFVDSAGVLQTAATDVPRFDHNPTTGESLGLLVEEQRTNSIRNNTGVGAVAGTPGTLPTNWTGNAATDLTREIVGTGTENGISYIDLKYTGTVSASRTQFLFFEPSNGISASNGQSWTGSAWVKIVAGSLANITSVAIQADTRDASLVYVSTPFVAAFTPTSAFTRYSGTGSATGATINWIQPFLLFTTASSGAIDITLRIGLPQLEQGAFATSPIPTTTAAVTRSADVASITGSAFSGFYNQNQITVYAETRQIGDILGFAFALSDGTDNNRIAQFRNTITFASRHTVAGSGFNPGSITISSSQTLARSAIASIAGSSGAAVNGVLATPSTPVAMPAVDRLQIALGAPGATQLNGTLRRLCCWGQRLPDSTLQQLTQ
jgi:hypothetical protein